MLGLRSRLSTSIAGLVALVMATGCVKNVARPGCPAHGGHPWYEVTTKHFVVRTDVEATQVASAVTELERGYSELTAAAFPRGAGGAERLGIVLLHDQREMSEYWPKYSGFSAERLGGDIEHTPTLVLAGSGYPPAVRATFLHELTHRFVAYTYGAVPIWLNEGLAQYYSTLKVEHGKMTLGEVVPGAYVPPGVAPNVRALLDADQSTFYANDVAVPYRRDEIVALYYHAAFAFVHMLSNGDDALRARFRLLRTSLGDGKSFVESWAKSVGEIPLEGLEGQFSRYASGWSWDRFVYDAPKIEVAPIEKTRPLADYEIDLMWARLLWGEKDGKELAKAALEAARSHDLDSPEVAYRAACMALRSDATEARALFHDVLVRTPDDPRALFGEVLAIAREWQGKSMPEAAASRQRDALARLESHARTADQLLLVARSQTEGNALDAALATAKRAVALDPGYFGGHVILAEAHFAAGRLGEAVAELEHGLAIVPDSVHAGKYVQLLGKVRAARDAARK
ncbi:MAG: hypothetical protein U0183_15420 [Polyangiaceae bacterium]